MASVPRKHHTVPAFYLRGFAHQHRGKPRVWVLDGLTGDWRRQNPEKVARETDFYTVDAAPLAPDAVETDVLAKYESFIAPLLGDVERRARTALEKLGPHPFTAPDSIVEHLATFVALMHARSSPTRTAQRAMTGELCRRMLSMFAPSAEEFEKNRAKAFADGFDVRDLPYDAIKRAIDGQDFKFDIDQTTYVGGMLGGWQALAGALMGKKCSLLVAGGSTGLLVASDNPVGYYRSGQPGELDVAKVDPRLPDSGVVLPLSPWVAIVFDPVLQPTVRRMTPKEVAVTNSTVAFGGDRLLAFALTQHFPWFHHEKGISHSIEDFLETAAALRVESDRVGAEFTRTKIDEAMARIGEEADEVG